jgi:hypothetical protein
MRQAQRDYFRARNPDALQRAKRCEHAVDVALAEIETGQLRLFRPGSETESNMPSHTQGAIDGKAT